MDPIPIFENFLGFGDVSGSGKNFYIARDETSKYGLWAFGSGRDWNTDTFVMVDTWQHLAVIFDGKMIAWYVDGDLRHSSKKYVYDSDDDYFRAGSEKTDFMLDELMIYSRALSSEEVQDLFKMKAQ